MEKRPAGSQEAHIWLGQDGVGDVIRRCRTSYLRKKEKADGVDRNLKTVGARRGWGGGWGCIQEASRAGTEAWGGQAEPEERGPCRQELSWQCWVEGGTGDEDPGRSGVSLPQEAGLECQAKELDFSLRAMAYGVQGELEKATLEAGSPGQGLVGLKFKFWLRPHL